MTSRAKRLVSGSILGGISFILRMFISLFMTPFMIASFGDHTYGLWMLIMSFSGFYGILDLGLSTAVQRYMARSVGAGDTEEANSVFNTSLAVFCAIGFLAAIFAGIAAWLAPVFVKSADDAALFRLLILLSSVNIVAGFPMRSFWGVLSSHLRFDISVYLDMANVVIKTALMILFLKMGFGVIAVALIHLLTDLVWNAANVFYAFKIAPYIRISKRYLQFGKLKTFFGYSVYVLISRIADMVKYNIDGYVISAFVGLSAVTVYSIGMRLVRYSTDFAYKLIGLMTPVFSQYEGEGNFDAIREKFFFLFKIGTYLAVFFTGVLVMLSRPFIMRWIGPGYHESYLIILIFTLLTVFSKMMIPSNQVLYGISKHKFLAWVNSGEAVINLILSLILVRIWGIRGVALGTVIPGLIVRMVVQPIYTARVLGISARGLYAQMALAMIYGTAVLAVLCFFTRSLIVPAFTPLIVAGMVYTVFYTGIIFWIGFSRSERHQLIKGFIPERLRFF